MNQNGRYINCIIQKNENFVFTLDLMKGMVIYMSISNEKINTARASLNQTSVSKSPMRSIGHLSNYGSSTPTKTLQEGQVMKGEVTDLRNNEVTITLEDNTYITGKLENGSTLSIGDTAAFKVVELNSSKITLKNLSQNETSLAMSTINKALLEADLPKSERNQSIVRELLSNQMSINKQSIQTILQQSLTFKNASISTLVLMNRHKIPMTEENTTQLENYRNHEHQLIHKINHIAEEVPALLGQLSDQKTGKDILSLVLNPKGSTSFSSHENPTVIFPTAEAATELIEILDMFSLDDSLKSQIQNGTATLRDLSHAIHESIANANELDSKNYAEAFLTQMSESEEINPEHGFEIPKTIELFDNPLVQSILDRFAGLQHDNNELASFLDTNQREHLLTLLKDLSLSEQMEAKVLTGEATTKEILTVIKNILSFTTFSSVQDLFQSAEFKHIFKEELLANWTLTPRSLQNGKEVEDFYPKMYEQLSELDQLVQSNLSGTNSSHLSDGLNQMKQNIDFMNTLNEVFTYIQLPIKLRNQNIHSELYVYTKKKDLRNPQDSVKILLHLDMEHLGPLDIHLTLASNQVVSTFYFEDSEAGQLLAEHMVTLENALSDKGFSFRADVQKREREVDIVRDYIEKDMPVASLKRYNFDIRA